MPPARRWVLLATLLPVLGLIGMVLADSVPDRLVMDQLVEATRNGNLDAEPYGVGMLGGGTDEFSECKRITIGLGDRPGTNPVESAVLSPTLGACPTAIPKIEGWAAGDGLDRSYDYYRYWNGSALVFRPGLVLFGVAGFRLLVGVGLVVTAALLANGVRRRVGGLGAGALLVPIVATTDFIDLPLATFQAFGMIATLLSGWIVLRFTGSSTSMASSSMISFALGAGFLYFADLTTPPGAWAMVTFTTGLVSVSTTSPARLVTRMVGAALSWIAGFAWMWLSKWIIAGFVVGFDTVLDVVRSQADERLSGPIEGFSTDPLSVLERVWHQWYGQPLTTRYLIVAAVVVVAVAAARREPRAVWAKRLVIASPAGIPVIWFAVMRNHTIAHTAFVYRDLGVVAGIVSCAMVARLSMGTSGADREDAATRQPSDARRPARTGRNPTGTSEPTDIPTPMSDETVHEPEHADPKFVQPVGDAGPESAAPEQLEAYDLDEDGKISIVENERARLGIVDARLEELAEQDGITGPVADVAHQIVDRLDND